jgi:hypothetical protein
MEVTHQQRIVQTKLSAQSRPDFGWYHRILCQLSERVARRQREHGEKNQTDGKQAGQGGKKPPQ